jgi:hypothetical protein
MVRKVDGAYYYILTWLAIYLRLRIILRDDQSRTVLVFSYR